MKEENKTEPTAEQSMEEKPFNQLEAVIKMSHEVARPWKYATFIILAISILVGCYMGYNNKRLLDINQALSQRKNKITLMADTKESNYTTVEQNQGRDKEPNK